MSPPSVFPQRSSGGPTSSSTTSEFLPHEEIPGSRRNNPTNLCSYFHGLIPTDGMTGGKTQRFCCCAKHLVACQRHKVI